MVYVKNFGSAAILPRRRKPVNLTKGCGGAAGRRQKGALLGRRFGDEEEMGEMKEKTASLSP
jgi:hypothetical protein